MWKEVGGDKWSERRRVGRVEKGLSRVAREKGRGTVGG